ncbi:MAG TPA: MlaD family protein [Chitinophagaceae bacterium]|nr:MlaD family protein [Chitinophagaceae bacterium]
MANNPNNLVKLGIFILAGILILILALFLIGKNQHLVGSHFVLRTHFANVAGLRIGNNVRYAGIEVGTVKTIEIINDTTVEVTMIIDKKMKDVIKKNALASLGADGLMGNKVVNIVPINGRSDLAVDGDLLASQKSVEFDDILRTLASTGENINIISGDLKQTVAKINNSKGLWKMLSDSGLALNLHKASKNLERATVNAEMMTRDVRVIIADVKAGNGPAGTILRDTVMAASLRTSVKQLEDIANNASSLANDLDSITRNVNKAIEEGPGTVNLILKDTAISGNIRRTLANVEKGTAAFDENMEAMRHNFLFKGYFKKQDKEKAKQQQQQTQ